MGYYIDRTSRGPLGPLFKAVELLAEPGAKKAELPVKFQPDLVCVVENGPFDAAGYCFDEQEFQDFNDPRDLRRKTWLVVPNAAKLSGYEDAARAHPPIQETDADAHP